MLSNYIRNSIKIFNTKHVNSFYKKKLYSTNIFNNKIPCKIIGTGSYFPNKIMTNNDLKINSNIPNNEWVINKLGIKQRHIVDKELSSDLGYNSAVNALNNSNLTINDIDLILTVTSSPDRISPSTACLIQEKFKTEKPIPCFDINAVCSGFLYSMEIASNLLNKYNKILIISSETYSKFTDWNHKNCVFFGDGSASVILTKANTGWFYSEIFADGSGKEHFTVKHNENFQMNGKEVYKTGTKVLPLAINNVLKKSKISIDEIDYLVPHQPSFRILEKTADIINLPRSKIVMNMDMRANTAGASIPTALDNLKSKVKLKNNDKILFAAVGSGWTWGAGILNYEI